MTQNQRELHALIEDYIKAIDLEEKGLEILLSELTDEAKNNEESAINNEEPERTTD